MFCVFPFTDWGVSDVYIHIFTGIFALSSRAHLLMFVSKVISQINQKQPHPSLPSPSCRTVLEKDCGFPCNCSPVFSAARASLSFQGTPSGILGRQRAIPAPHSLSFLSKLHPKYAMASLAKGCSSVNEYLCDNPVIYSPGQS